MNPSDKEVRALIQPLKPIYETVECWIDKVAYHYNAVVFWEDFQSFYIPDSKSIHLEDANTMIFCHELAHHLQYTAGANPLRNTFQEDLAFERQAERIAYYLHKEHFYYIHHARFSAYRCREHREFLWGYHRYMYAKEERYA